MGRPFLVPITVALLSGAVARLYLLRVDYRQYPSYPQGYVTHLFLGVVASALGAVAIPALLGRDYAAVTFLSLAAQQFREIRGMERDSLEAIESVELVPRGPAYIEDIAKVFEARNYVAMVTALVVSALTIFLPLRPLPRVLGSIAAGACLVLFLQCVLRGRRVGDYAEVSAARVEFDGPSLLVDGIYLMNVGREEARRTIREHGLGAVLKPKDPNARTTLASIGQRQALVHDVASVLGVRRDLDEPEFAPIARLDHETGHTGMVIVPIARDAPALAEAIRRVPIIESVKRRPLAAESGREAFGSGDSTSGTRSGK